MKTAIVIPSFNRRTTTLLCLRALYPLLASDHLVIVADSGSSDGTQQAILDEFPKTILLQGDPSEWWTGAINRGIRRAMELGCQRLVTYNDDNIALPGLFDALARAADEYPDDIIAAVVCYAYAPEKVFFAGRQRSRFSDRFFYLDHNGYREQLGDGVREVDLLHGMCTLFPCSIFKILGLFDAQVFPHLFADDDLVLKAQRGGYRSLVALNAVVLNDRNKTSLNPYDRRLGAGEIWQLLVSQKSVFQVTRRCRFYWRHRRSLPRFLLTVAADYLRVGAIIVVRWLLPDKSYLALYDWASRRVHR